MLWYLSAESGFVHTVGERMFFLIKRILGWIFGTLFALVIVLAVRFFERRLRFQTRRDPAWRSQ
jgi:hypothetical protein